MRERIHTIDPSVRRYVGVGKKEKLPRYVWPGGYPLFYIDHDCAAICPKCANSKRWSDKYIVAAEVNWENPSLYCEHCNNRIESAYAEDEVGRTPAES